jgi:hypothetical protein
MASGRMKAREKGQSNGDGSDYKSTEFYDAVLTERVSEVASLLVDERVDVNAFDQYGQTVLMVACYLGHGKAVTQLLECLRVKVNAGGKRDGSTALSFAARGNHNPIVIQLINCDRVDVNAANYSDVTAIFMAADQGYETIVSTLSNCERVDVDRVSLHGTQHVTAIMMAVTKGFDSIVDMLAEAGANLSLEQSQKSLRSLISTSIFPSPKQRAAVHVVLKKHGITKDCVPSNFQSKHYFQDGQGQFYIRNLKYQRWINRKEFIMCLHYTYNWSVENQVEDDAHRTLPSDLSKVGHFVAHCFFDAAGGEYGNGIARLITQYYGGFDASKSSFALRGMPAYGKLPDNAVRCSNCLEKKKESKALLRCASCGFVRYCGRECQKTDWKRHKESCKLWSEENKKKGGDKKKN